LTKYKITILYVQEYQINYIGNVWLYPTFRETYVTIPTTTPLPQGYDLGTTLGGLGSIGLGKFIVGAGAESCG
jgi:hypothetical protein